MSIENYKQRKRIEYAATNAEKIVSANEITFVLLAENGTIDPVTAGEHAEMFTEWAAEVTYSAGNIRRYDGKLYKCLQAHTSQSDWTPDTAVSLWRGIADPADPWPAWAQPIGASDAYNINDKVSHKGRHWISTANNNVWEPGVYGWSKE